LAATPRRARAQTGAGESRRNKKAEVIAMMKRAKGVTCAIRGARCSCRLHSGCARINLWIRALKEGYDPRKFTSDVNGAAVSGLGDSQLRIAFSTLALPRAQPQENTHIPALLVALWLTFHVRTETNSMGWRKLASAVLMGSAIPVMHYTGMAAVTFRPMTSAVGN
jgi:Bacterial signalling protein N terminal repeat